MPIEVIAPEDWAAEGRKDDDGCKLIIKLHLHPQSHLFVNILHPHVPGVGTDNGTDHPPLGGVEVVAAKAAAAAKEEGEEDSLRA